MVELNVTALWDGEPDFLPSPSPVGYEMKDNGGCFLVVTFSGGQIIGTGFWAQVMDEFRVSAM